jgi:hypothetical protein
MSPNADISNIYSRLGNDSPHFERNQNNTLKIDGLEGLRQLQMKQKKKKEDSNMDNFFPDRMSSVSPADSIVTSPSGKPTHVF